ncbi:hypothetical protein DSCW_27730 [Desulfosarcina widdelii]|uniref:Lipoprotein n=1 Tax=Desulfosarcina widdelii TaxID=947919 RepID=A0A5K7Z0Y6_9BACT|nr:hypothetical protein DSCW_27730 [Desulfosarcina widdelii]
MIAALLLAACASMQAMQPLDADRETVCAGNCRSHFPEGGWQMVHTISANIQGGRQATFTGVVILSPEDDSIRCAVMTLEGFVLFEAVDYGRVTVKRAFGPFDDENFAKGVMDDIRFLFVEPEGETTCGIFEDGSRGCRYRAERNRTVDLMEGPDGGWRMRQYDSRGYPMRTMTADAPNADGFSRKIVLQALGSHGYRLTMTLVEAVSIQEPPG